MAARPRPLRTIVLLGIAAGGLASIVASCSSSPTSNPVPVVESDGPPAVACASGANSCIPITIVTMDDQGVRELAIPISINGSAPFLVQVDTGSTGLRVFDTVLSGTAVTETTQPISVAYGTGGSGFQLHGVKASGVVTLGTFTTSTPIDFQLVSEDLCPHSDCLPNDWAAHGIGGIIGVGLRQPDATSPGIYSPIAQLGAPLSDAFLIRTGGFAATAGELILGVASGDGGGDGGTFEGGSGEGGIASPEGDAGLAPSAIMLARQATNGSLPNGLAAWADDQINLCFSVNMIPLGPPCSRSIFDTGARNIFVFAQNNPAPLTSGGALAPGATFEATDNASFDLRFTVGESSATSLDSVQFYGSGSDISIVGLPAFFRNDIGLDLKAGRVVIHHL